MNLCPQLRRLSADHARWLAAAVRRGGEDEAGEEEEEGGGYVDGWQSGFFRVEEFRVPLMKGVVEPPKEPAVNASTVPERMSAPRGGGGVRGGSAGVGAGAAACGLAAVAAAGNCPAPVFPPNPGAPIAPPGPFPSGMNGM